MILKTYLKTNKIVLDKNLQSNLGRNVYRSFSEERPNETLLKVSIKSASVKMQVYDYPKEYFESKSFNKVLKRFLSKHKIITIVSH